VSLLPGQIIPQDVPLGQADELGLVTIDKQWWLLLYQLCQQVLSNGSGATTLELADLGLLKASGTDYDRQIADLRALWASLPNPAGRIAALERQVADLQQLVYSALKVWN